MPALLPDAMPAVVAYQAVCTQWRVVAGLGGGGCTGLDYAACLPVLRALRNEWEAAGDTRAETMTDMDLLEDVQTVELAILEVQQEQRDAAAAAQGGTP